MMSSNIEIRLVCFVFSTKLVILNVECYLGWSCCHYI